jgi:diguanylate cyclase (GGDEF)-like protein
VTDRPDPASVLAEGARTLARGKDLDGRLKAFAAQARALSGAQATVIYLLDGSSGRALPAAWDGYSDHEVDGLSAERGPDTDDPVMRAARERHTEIVESGGPSGLTHVYSPLVIEDATEGQEVDGVLSGAFAAGRPPDETVALLEAVADLAAVAVHHARVESALAERSDWFDRLSQTDALTGLANRRTFDRVLELELARAARQGTSLSVALFDINDLDGIMRRHGATVGDDVLRRVASSLADSVRLVDTIARYGGDEFALVAPGAAGRLVAERVVRQVAAAGSELPDPIGLRAGVARFPDQGATAQELLAAADGALREAKRSGTQVAEATGSSEDGASADGSSAERSSGDGSARPR